MSNQIDKDLFEKKFDHKFEILANKLINTTNKEENQIIVKNIEKKKLLKWMIIMIVWSNQIGYWFNWCL